MRHSHQIRLDSDHEKTILEAKISELTTGVKLFPASTSVVIRLGGFDIMDYVSNPSGPIEFLGSKRQGVWTARMIFLLMILRTRAS